MASFPRRFYLRSDERVITDERITPAWAAEQAVVWLVVGAILFGGLFVPVVLSELDERGTLLVWIGVAYLAFWLLMLIYAWRRIVTTEFVVTDEAMYARRGRLLLSLDAATLDRVTDLHVHTGIVGRIFGYSRLVAKTAGGEIVMVGLRDAYTLRGSIQDARQRLLTRLLREAGRHDERPKSSSAALDIECPKCAHAFAVLGAPPIDVQCPNCKSTGTLFAEALA